MLLKDIDHVKQILFEEHMADRFSVWSPFFISRHCIESANQEAGPKDTVLYSGLLDNFAASPYVYVLNDVGVHDERWQDAAVVNSNHRVLFGIKFGLIGGPCLLV